MLYEIILMPADEWLGKLYGTSDSLGDWGPMLYGTNYLDIDSTLFPKKMVYAPVRTRAADNIESQWTNTNVRSFRTATERRTRYWFLTQNPDPVAAKAKYANHPYSQNIQLFTTQQYFSSIGSDL